MVHIILTVHAQNSHPSRLLGYYKYSCVLISSDTSYCEGLPHPFRVSVCLPTGQFFNSCFCLFPAISFTSNGPTPPSMGALDSLLCIFSFNESLQIFPRVNVFLTKWLRMSCIIFLDLSILAWLSYSLILS